MSTFDRLKDPALLVAFLYAPTGLGHLRVTNALYEGLPPGSSDILLGAQNMVGNVGHRFMSAYPLTRAVMEFFQYGLPEKIITFAYRQLLRFGTKSIEDNLRLLLKEQMTVPKTLLLVATHFGLAHQLAAVKKQYAKQQNIKVFLVVQVTDDSPQLLWDIPGADIIVCPSQKTQHELSVYHQHQHSSRTTFVTAAFPISPLFAASLTKDQFAMRCHQVDPQHNAVTHIAIPISGAAIGLSFTQQFIHSLSKLSSRFRFHVVAKKSIYTESFLRSLWQYPNVETLVSTHDREVIALYEQLYMTRPIALEITKPSEQTFKVLADPKKVGGSILLFTEPVGRQEYDNLGFLNRHSLIPPDEHMFSLCSFRYPKKNISPANWRGLILPELPGEAAQLVDWALKSGIFLEMMKYQPPTENSREHIEVNPYGVQAFWKTVSYLLT